MHSAVDVFDATGRARCMFVKETLLLSIQSVVFLRLEILFVFLFGV